MFELPEELFEIDLSNLKNIVVEPRLNNGWTIYYDFKEKMGYEQCVWVSIVIYGDKDFEFSYCTNINGSHEEVNAIKKIMNTNVANYLELLGYKSVRDLDE